MVIFLKAWGLRLEMLRGPLERTSLSGMCKRGTVEVVMADSTEIARHYRPGTIERPVVSKELKELMNT